MMGMLQSSLKLRVGTVSVTAELRPWRGARVFHSTALQADDGNAVPAAVNEALQRVLQARRLANPRVSVSLGSALTRSGVMRFAALPRSAGDRALIVSQRFCRDYKLDGRSTVVAFSTYPQANGQHAVLADAAPRALIDGLIAAAASHGLHCDIISSDLSLALAGLPRQPAAAGLLAVFPEEGCSLVFLDAHGAPVSVATLAQDDATLADRLAARIDRYAAQSGVAIDRMALHVRDHSGRQAAAALSHLFTQARAA
ncbi:MAG: hypothetical protein Q7T86_16935 [Hyphomicrobiaceae bacterium]|nr:hypothetical protein [Hyphomicrobiaceae bacterium]